MIPYFIEFLDELVFGITEAAWPFIRNDLQLTYVQIGLALSLPGIIANFIEPFIFIASDRWRRRVLMLIGGVFFTVSLFLTSISFTFILLISSFILFHPSSGAFVNLAQVSLMDAAPERREHNMARWTFSGSLGTLIGPMLLAGAAYIGFGWRGAFFIVAIFSTLILLIAFKFFPQETQLSESFNLFMLMEGLKNTFHALRNWTVLRWLILLEFSDLMLDILYSFLPLYFVDAAGFTPTQAALSVLVWTGVGVLGDFLLIPLLEKVKGLDYLRVSVILEMLTFPFFLLSTQSWLKLILVGLMGFFNSGWYAILKAKLFESMHGQSGTALVLDNVSGMIGKLIPLGIGLAAQAFGLAAAMWLLLAGPIMLFIGLPKKNSTPHS